MKIIEHDFNTERIKKIQESINIDSDILNFLINKNYTDTEIKLLTNDDIEEVLSDNNISYVKEASNLINKYLLNNNAQICIYSDYDSDGINAGFIFYDCLNQLIKCLNSKCSVGLYIPQRTEGYGLNINWCKSLVDNKNNKDLLVITSDNGISKRQEVAFLKSKGIDVLITDHHRPQDDLIPKNVIIVDPCFNDIGNKNAEGLCGTAVVYKICSYLLNDIYKDTSNYSNVYLPHVAIATITDMMPITEENIIYVKNGLHLINNKYCNKALQYYIDYKGDSIKPKDIAFELGPQINSCGRMGEVEKAVSLLLADNEDDVIDIYNEIVLLNDSRKEVTKKTTAMCQEKISEIVKDSDQIIILRIKNAGGVAGNVANQLLKIYNKPIILLNDNNKEVLTGSCRSANINLQDLFKSAQDNKLIESFGGHNEAAGINISKSKIKIFKDFCNDFISEYLLQYESSKEEEFMYVDKIVSLKDLNINTVKKYGKIFYFNSLQEPLFALKDVCINNITCSKSNPNNLCFFFKDDDNNKIPQGLWCWKYKDIYDNLGKPTKVNIVFSLSNFKNMLVMDIKHMEAV